MEKNSKSSSRQIIDSSTAGQLSAWLQSLNEDQVYPLIRDLLKTMGYKRVTITHGTQEYGRDLVFLDVDKLGREIWYAVQVKVTALIGSMSSDKSFRGTLNQCEAALDTPYTTSDGKNVRIDEVWLITTKPLSESAKASAQQKLNNLRKKVYVIDGGHLADLLNQYLPDLLKSGSRPLDDYLIKLVEYCDSVEHYVSVRLRTRFSLEDVFVPPSVSVCLISSDCVGKLPKLAAELRLSRLAELLPLLPLAKDQLLPAILHLEASDIITRILRVSRAISDMVWWRDLLGAGDFEPPAQVAQKLATSLDLVAAVGLDSARLPWKSGYCCSVSIQALQAYESSIVALDFDEVRPLRDNARLRDSAYSRARGEIKLARESFFMRLRSAYNVSLNAKDPMTQIAVAVAKLFVKPASLPSAASEYLERLTASIELFQEMLVLRLQDLWGHLGEPLMFMRRGGHLESRYHSELVELEQLTRFVEEFCGVGEGNCEGIEKLVFDGLAICTDISKVILIGELGMGKTTLLKRVGATHASRTLEHEGGRLPVLCSLATLPRTDPDELSRQMLRAARGGFKGLENIAADDLVWLLDGFDEIQSHELREAVIEWVCRSPRGRRILISSRPHAIPEYLPNILAATLVEFSQEKIERLVREFPWEDIGMADSLLAVLRKAPELQALSRTPLFLTLIIILAQTYGAKGLPRRREGLYRVILDLLLGEWDLSKGVNRQYEVEEKEVRLKVLRKVAFRLYYNNRRSFTRDEFFESLAVSNPSKPFTVDASLGFLADLVRDCIIVPLGRESFGFFHFSMQEYLAAEELRDDVYPDRVFSAIAEFSRTGWWEEVLVFYAGLKRDMKDLIEEMHSKSIAVYDGNRISPSFLRLMGRMLDAANFTDLNVIQPRSFIAATFAELNINGEREKWRRLARSRVFEGDAPIES